MVYNYIDKAYAECVDNTRPIKDDLSNLNKEHFKMRKEYFNGEREKRLA